MTSTGHVLLGLFSRKKPKHSSHFLSLKNQRRPVKVFFFYTTPAKSVPNLQGRVCLKSVPQPFLILPLSLLGQDPDWCQIGPPYKRHGEGVGVESPQPIISFWISMPPAWLTKLTVRLQKGVMKLSWSAIEKM